MHPYFRCAIIFTRYLLNLFKKEGSGDGYAQRTFTHTAIHEIRRAARAPRFLLELGSGTKAELSDRLGISFPTVSKVLEQMAQEGEVTLLGLDESSGGRRANRYAFNPDYMLGLAVYYEKERSVYTIFNWNGDLVERQTEEGILQLGPEALASQLRSWIHRYPKIRSIAVGMPAAVRDGVVFTCRCTGHSRITTSNLT